jgi:hypothetical protein
VKLPRSVVLAYLDFSDSLRPGIFDALILVLSLVGVILSYIQHYGSSSMLALSILSPTLLATALYLALRSAAGLAYMASEGVLDLYLYYPLSRATTGVVLLVSRVIVPTILIIGLPALAASIVYYPLISREPYEYTILWGSFIVQALFYGFTFSLIALLSKKAGSASILSLLYYFTYNILSLILQNLASSTESVLFKLSRSMSFYLVVYQRLNPSSIAGKPEAWELSLIPLLTLVIAISFVVYFSRRYEP